MRVLYINRKGHEMQKGLEQLLNLQFVQISTISSSPFSGFTAMKISKAAEEKEIEIVHTPTLPDAMAAISARKIAKHKNWKVVAELAPNAEIPKGIPSDIIEGVDAWIFPSERMMGAFPAKPKLAITIQPYDFDFLDSKENISDKEAIPAIAWIGKIDNNTSRLIEAIKAVDKCSTDMRLCICGTAKARSVMPAVKYSRHISHPQRIIWASTEAEISKAISMANAVVQAMPDIDKLEAAMASMGKTLIQVEEIKDFAVRPKPTNTGDFNPDNYANQLADLYRTLTE